MRPERTRVIMHEMIARGCCGEPSRKCVQAPKLATRTADIRCIPRRPVPAWIRPNQPIYGHNWDGKILEVDLFTGDVLVDGDDGDPPIWIDVEDLPYVASPDP